MRLEDKTGKRFGRLLVLGVAGKIGKNTKWHCICDCGNRSTPYGGALNAGESRSCGCLQKESIKKHGLSGTPIYRIWYGMLHRCNRKSDPNYKYYGGRGITVCDKWSKSVEDFYSDMGEPPKGMSIDRKDNNGNYAPENCRWATPIQQARNTRKTLNIKFRGKTQCLTAWANEIGMSRQTLSIRLKRGWSVEDALTTQPLTK